MKGDGFLHVASFVQVVFYNEEDYPKGIKYYEVNQGKSDEAEEDKQG